MAKTILFLSANPLNTNRLRLDIEIREIEEGFLRAKFRTAFKIQQKHALRMVDLRRAMLDYEPQIVHFSGHGAGVEGIILEDESGQPSLLGTDTLEEFFRFFKNVECVFLNACYSKIQAEAIAKTIKYVIGMSCQIDDVSARNFSVAFYDSLGAGKSIEDAFGIGCNALKMAGISDFFIPVLIPSDTNISQQLQGHKLNPFYIAGTMPPNMPSYITRESDITLSEAIEANQFIALHGEFEIGKSSMLLRCPSYSDIPWRSVFINFQKIRTDDISYFVKDFFIHLTYKFGSINTWDELAASLRNEQALLQIDDFGHMTSDVAAHFLPKLYELMLDVGKDSRVVVSLPLPPAQLLKNIGVSNPKYLRCWHSINIIRFSRVEMNNLLSFLPDKVYEIANRNLDIIMKHSEGKPRAGQCLCDKLFRAVYEEQSEARFRELIHERESYQ